jgi:hypothetical protein
MPGLACTERMPGVPGIQPTADSGAGGKLDSGDERRNDNRLNR